MIKVNYLTQKDANETECEKSPDLTVTIWPGSSWMPFIWAMKMAATASYRAVPSMLMVAPTGSTNRVTLLSMPRFSSRQRKVTGSVPAL